MSILTSTTQINENNDSKVKNIICLIHYNDTDDQSVIFNVLQKFRTERGLKFSHHKNIIFFILSSEYLEEFAKIRPFKVSKFQTKTAYKTTKDEADKLIAQKDSFLRLTWDESTSSVIFLSRTTLRVHNNLIRRIFKDSNTEFTKTEYSVIKFDSNAEQVNKIQTEQVNKVETEQINKLDADGFITVQGKTEKPKVYLKGGAKGIRTIKVKPEVQTENKNSNIEVVQETTKPKIRGTKSKQTN